MSDIDYSRMSLGTPIMGNRKIEICPVCGRPGAPSKVSFIHKAKNTLFGAIVAIEKCFLPQPDKENQK